MTKVGDAAPDFALEAATGETLSLSECLGRHKSALLVFLRHLG